MATYNVSAYTGKEIAAEGHRLSILTYRQTEEDKKAKKPKKENKCVEIPRININEALDTCDDEKLLTAAWKAIQSAIDDWQDGIIKNLVDNGGAQDIHEDKINFAAIIAHANAENSKKRMSKEGIAAWFDTDMLPGITERLVAKATPEEKIIAVCGNYSEAYQKLASIAPKINKADAQKLIDLAKQIAPPSSMLDDITKKLDLILQPEKLDLEEII